MNSETIIPDLEDVAAKIASMTTTEDPIVDTLSGQSVDQVEAEKLIPDEPTTAGAGEEAENPILDEYKKAVSEFEAANEINDALLNVPDYITVSDEEIPVKSKTLYQLEHVNKSVLLLNQINVKETELDFESKTYWEDLLKIQAEGIYAMVKCFFHIINKDYEEPKYTEDWIKRNVDVSDDGEGCELLEAFTRRNIASRFLSLLLQARKI